MCLYLFPTKPKKHRVSAYDDPRPRKRRKTSKRLPSASASEASSPVRDEPPRKHVRVQHGTSTYEYGYNSPEVAHVITAVPVVQMSGGVLRGRGAKRDPPMDSLHGKGVKRAGSQRSSIPKDALRKSSRTREMRARDRPRTAYIPATQPLYLPPHESRISARGHPLRMPQSDVRMPRPEMTQMPASRRWSTPPLGSSVPDDYLTYLDFATVRAATNYALRATIYEAPLPPRPTPKRDLRRRPAYNCLQ